MMKIRCPYCGNEVKKDEIYCTECVKRIDWAYDFWKKSVLYYNAGYKAAKSRDLTLAEVYLKKAILANKYHIEARNLLGLVYYEVGMVGEALKEWIISSSLVKENNKAVEYIKAIQKEPRVLEHDNEAIRLYNQSLEYLKQKNTDMAIIRLKKAVSLNQKFVKARVLLALCYMYNKQYYKANELLKKTLMIDAGEKDALKYYYELSKEDTEGETTYPIKYETKTPAVKGISPNAVLDRQVLLTRSILYFALGVISIFIIYTYLILPSKVQEYKEQLTEMTQVQQGMQDKMQQLTSQYDEQVAELEKAKVKLESEVTSYESQVGVLSQKEKLASAQQLKNEGHYIEAAEKIYNIASSKLDKEDITAYEEVKALVYPEANNNLYNEGINFYNSADYASAISRFETILLYEPEDRMARKTLYYLGCSELENGDTDNAKKYFNKLLSEYADSYEAQEATRKLDNLTI